SLRNSFVMYFCSEKTAFPASQLITYRKTMLDTCFFFYDTTTTAISTLSLHDALPILQAKAHRPSRGNFRCLDLATGARQRKFPRSEEHTSELQSRGQLVCRPPLEKKKL